MRRPNWRARRIAATLAIAVLADGLLCDLWSDRHELAVVHGTCAQHGAPTHVAAPPRLTDARVVLADHGPAYRLRRACRIGSDLHEHCAVALASGLRSRAAWWRPPAQPLALDPGAAVRVAERAPPFHLSPRCLLATAPKTSPPRS